MIGRVRDITFGVLLAAFSVWIWWQASTFPSLGRYPGPSLFPQVVAGSLLLASLALIGVAMWRWRTGKNTNTQAHTAQHASLRQTVTAASRVLAGLVCVVLFPILQARLSGWLALGLLCVGVALLLRVKALTALLVGTATSVMVTLAFRYLLGVPIG